MAPNYNPNDINAVVSRIESQMDTLVARGDEDRTETKAFRELMLTNFKGLDERMAAQEAFAKRVKIYGGVLILAGTGVWQIVVALVPVLWPSHK